MSASGAEVSKGLPDVRGLLPHWLTIERLERLAHVAGGARQIASGDEYARRIGSLRRKIRTSGMGFFSTFKPASIHWLTGYTTSSPGKVVLAVTDDEVRLRAAASELGRGLVAPGVTAIDAAGWDGPLDVGSWLAGVAKDAGAATVGLELSDRWTPAFLLAAAQEQNIAVFDASDVVDRLRLIPSQTEIDYMRRAAKATAAGYAAAESRMSKDDVRDIDIASDILCSLTSFGNSLARGNVVVGVDSRGGIPHSDWNGKIVNRGSVVFTEFSGAFNGYCAPVMRTFVKGHATPDITKLHRLVEQMLDATIPLMRPGAIAARIAKAGQKVIENEKGVLFHGNFGYPVGLSDWISWMNGAKFHVTTENVEPLKEGMVFHVPLVLRRLGEYAVGESQTVRVGDPPEILTECVPTGLAII